MARGNRVRVIRRVPVGDRIYKVPKGWRTRPTTLPTPANDNYRRLTKRDVARMLWVGRHLGRNAGKFARGAATALDLADAFDNGWKQRDRERGRNGAEVFPDPGPRTRRNPSAMPLPSGFPSRNGGNFWVWRHGPNAYPGTNYGHGNVTAQANSTAFFNYPPTGPQTGLITGQAIVNNGVGTTPGVGSNRLSLWIKSVSLDRYAQWAAWERAATATDNWRGANDPLPAPLGAPARSPFARPPHWLPAQFPGEFLPGLAPNPLEAPGVPVRANPAVDAARNEWAGPGQGRKREYEVAPQAPPLEVPVIEPGVDPGPGPKPNPEPQPEPENPPASEISPGRAPRIGRAPRAHRMQPPPPRVKERKMKLGFRAGLGLVGDVFGAMTEAGDLVEALWEALPESEKVWSYHQGRRIKPSKWRQARNLYHRWDKIDAARAVNNVIQSQAQDAVIGSLAGSHGFQSGQLMKRMREMQDKARERERKKMADKLRRNRWQRGDYAYSQASSS